MTDLYHKLSHVTSYLLLYASEEDGCLSSSKLFRLFTLETSLQYITCMPYNFSCIAIRMQLGQCMKQDTNTPKGLSNDKLIALVLLQLTNMNVLLSLHQVKWQFRIA